MKPLNENVSPITYPFNMGYLPSEFVKKAEQELFETPEKLKEQVQDIRRLLRREEGIEDEWFSDSVIIMYLRGRKYRTLETLSSIKKTISFIKKYPQFFQPPDPETMDRLVNEDSVKIMPQRDENGCLIIVVRLGRWNASKTKFEDLMKYSMMTALAILSDPMTQVNGVILIYDFQHHVLRYMKYFTPFYVYAVYQILIECLPMRTKSIHLMNPSMLAKIALSLVLPVCSEKIKSRIMFHDKPDEICDHVQKNVLPMEYGGDLNDHDDKYRSVWMKTVSFPNYVTSIIESLKS